MPLLDGAQRLKFLRKSAAPKPTLRRPSALRRYGGALAIVSAATLLRYWLEPVLEPAGFALSLAGIIIAAWVGELEASLLAQTFVLAAEKILFDDEDPQPWEPSISAFVSIGAYYLVGSTVALLSEAVHAAQRRAYARQQEAKAERDRLDATLHCMGDGVIVADASGAITLINPSGEKLLARPAGDCLGRPLASVWSPSDAPLAAEADAAFSFASFSQITAADGRQFPVSYSTRTIFDGRAAVAGSVIVFRDESQRCHYEQTLWDADRRKTEFLATLAHELRNPLAPIRMGAELLKPATHEPGAEELRAMIERQSLQMTRLIDDLLDVSRITRGKLELKRRVATLEEVVRTSVEASRPTIDEGEHTLQVNMSAGKRRLYVDSNRITQAISNLLNNAAKFTPRGGRIELSAKIVDNELLITVSDNGPGIPPDKLDAVFEMFAQVNGSLEHGHTGLGIGLTLAKQLVEMHGGCIGAESGGAAGGTRFYIRLPLADVPPEPSLDQQTSDGSPRRRRVLIADDNHDALIVLSRMINLMGHDVREAHNGREAFEIAEDYRPDIAILDIGMPELNGYELAERIRSQSWGGSLSLIALTGWGQDEDRRRTAAAGFDLHLVKPVDMQILRRVLSEAPRSQQLASLAGKPVEHVAASKPKYEPALRI